MNIVHYEIKFAIKLLTVVLLLFTYIFFLIRNQVVELFKI